MTAKLNRFGLKSWIVLGKLFGPSKGVADLQRTKSTALAKIPCPTLVVRGAASDVMSPEVADKMVDEVLPKGTLAVVPQAAHSVMTDNPDGFNKAVCAFVLRE